ncbi:erythronate-4-phosphate dehydrogenase [Gammaproteobacteria bacterium]|nr:erythronate-4-phosphate dehydrogenase [Gammaproteobacteria bacterium]
MKVVVDKDIKNFIDLANELDGLQDIKFTYVTSKEIDNNLLIDADVLFIRSTTKIDKKLLENSSVKLIGSATAGIDHIDIDYLESSQIRWFYSPGCNSSSVVHYVLSSIGYLKKINVMNEDSIIGIIGCGNVGSKLRLILNKLKIKNMICDPYKDFDYLSSMEEVSQCEVISLHTPLTFSDKYATHNMIDKYFLATSKVETIINTSRGSIVNEKDLVEANHINYISDVWENEPCPDTDIIKKAILATPHVAGHSYEGKINGTINLLSTFIEVINISEKNMISNKKLLSNMTQKIFINNDINLSNFIDSYDIFNESIVFKELSNKSDQFIPAADFINIRRMHKIRNDIF